MSGVKAYRIDLSLKDEVVPKDYISIYKIFTEEKYALPNCEKGQWCMGEETLRKTRYKIFNEVKERFEFCKAQNFSKFWNGNLDAFNDLGINIFATYPLFSELAGAMICFEKNEKNKTNGKVRKLIGWGIKDSLYREYYKAQLESIETGNPPREVCLYDPKKKRVGNVYKQRQDKIKFTENGETRLITLDKNAIFCQFEHWCKLKGLKKQEGMYQAMLYIMANYPADNLKELGAYERKCEDLNYTEVLVPERTNEDNIVVMSRLPKREHKLMSNIIHRYNADVENSCKPRLSIDKYIVNAVHQLNLNMPLRYSDPKRYKDWLDAKEAQEYNKKVSEL